MKVGLIARAEDRGLGNLTWEWHRHMRPDRTLLVVPDSVQKAGLTSHVDRYPDATPARFGANATLDHDVCDAFLDGLDVVFTAETFYDWRFCRWARLRKVATVCMAMPEFCRPDWFDQPTQWWAPTTYRLDHLPPSTRLVPVPIPTDRFNEPLFHDGPLRWLHVAGAQTIADRNGTRAVVGALHAVTSEAHVSIRTQTPVELGSFAARAVVTHDDRNVVDYWTMYDNADVVLLPRRYAGLCLPALEAMGAGLPVVMTDLSPQNTDWPVALIETRPGADLRLGGGRIETGDADPGALAELIDVWNGDRSIAAYHAERVRTFAATHSWDALRPKIVAELQFAADRA